MGADGHLVQFVRGGQQRRRPEGSRESPVGAGNAGQDHGAAASRSTCFPGCYSNRAVHIHFRVHRGSDAYTTSQLFFDDALVSEIFAGHPE